MAKTKRVAIVTGASGGIGAMTALQLAKDGHAVALIARRGEKLEALRDEIRTHGGTAEAFPCNLAKAEALTDSVEQVQKAMGHISIIVSNAAAGPSGRTVDKLPMKEWDLLMAVNARSAYLLAYLLFPEMKERGFGRLITISSILGVATTQNNFAFIASKHALVGLTRALAAEWGRHGITSNVICPGYVDTPGLDGYSFENLKERLPTPNGVMGKSEDMAEIISFLAQESTHYMNGAVIVADGGLLSDLGVK